MFSKTLNRFFATEPSSGILGYLAASFTFCPSSFIFSPAWCAGSLIVSATFSVACFNVSAVFSMPSLTLSVVEPIMCSPVDGGDVSEPILRISPVSGVRVLTPPYPLRAKPRPEALHPPTSISQHHIHREARADVVHSFISNVMQASRTVCEIPAQNIGILRQSG